MSVVNNKLYYTYTDINNLIKNKKTDLKNLNVDLIIAIGGGGLIPGRIARNYIEKDIYVITVKLYNSDDTIGKIDVIQWINIDLKDKNVLIIDEINDTGTTLDYCINKLYTDNNMNKFSVFVLNHKDKIKAKEIKVSGEYIIGENIKDYWVVYPWDTLLSYPNN
uniref:Phosphoribosyltransferase domain-containing protein n=1 Tax=viral metagenome TaxID=1070528 RepID=A0A6C0J0T2_9ZZZZ